MGTYSIKDLEQLSGIKAHTIRIWEQRYGIISPDRTDTNIRSYDDQQLKYLLNVALLTRNGFKISRISSFKEEEFHREIEKLYEQSMLHDTDAQLDLDANDLMVAMIEMNAEKFDRIYGNSVRKNGFEKTITGLIYPFLEKVGVLWQLNQINPAQEHFISALIRQKIIVAIDQLPNSSDGKSFILFLPEGEFHEIGLLMAAYLIKNKGGKIYYLGQSLPDNDLRIACETIAPDAILSFMVDPIVVNNASRTLENYLSYSSTAKVLVATRESEDLEPLKANKRLHFLHGITDLDQYI